MALKKFEKAKNKQAGLATSEEIKNANLMPAGYVGDAQQKAIPIDLIDYHPDNDYRNFETTDEDIARFADVIEKDGFHGSLVVVEKPAQGTRAGKNYLLLGGERRLRALRLLCERNKELRIRYATVPCTVVTNLSADPDIRHRQEMLILDGDNIHTRNGLIGIGDDAFAAKVTARYVENMMVVYHLSEADAKRTLKEATLHNNDRTIDRNWRLYKQLTNRMFVIYLGGKCDVDKHTLEKMTVLNEEEQDVLADALDALSEARATGMDEDAYKNEVKTLRDGVEAVVSEEAGDARIQAASELKTHMEITLNAARRAARVREARAMIDGAHKLERLNEIFDGKSAEEKRRQAAEARRAAREAAANAPAEVLRKKYTDSIEKSIENVRKLAKKANIKRVRGVNREGAITLKLAELEAAIAELREQLGED